MIDTIRLRLQDFEVTGEAPLTVQPVPFSPASGEAFPENDLYKLNGEVIRGSKAYLNSDRFRFDINSKGAFLTTEAPRWFGESNFQSMTDSRFQVFTDMLKKELRENGIHTDIENAKLSRVDLFRNGRMRNPPVVYMPVLRSCRGRRVYKRDYGDTVLFYNTRREACFYDKFLQMEKKGWDVSGVHKNTMRGEVRLKTSGTVRSFLDGITTFKSLRENFQLLPSVYNRQLSDMVFRYGVDAPEQLSFFGDDLRTLIHFKEVNNRTAFTQWISSEGIVQILQRYGDIEHIRRLLLQVFSKGAVSRQIRRIEEIISQLRRLGIGRVSYLDLYSELTETFLKVA